VREFTVTGESLAGFFVKILPHLDERQRRMVAGAQARMLGYGGVTAVKEASGLAASTVQKGAGEIDSGVEPSGRVRAAGAGRPRAEVAQPGVGAALDKLIEPYSYGDPMSPLRWTTKSLRTLSDELGRQGFEVSAPVVGEMLVADGYSLQSVAKVEAGSRHPDRDAQFRYIHKLVGEFLAAGDPVISVDAKKKELVGNFAQPGRAYRPSGEPERALDHDFPDPELGKATPYGVYDVGRNDAWVGVGSSADTAEFAVCTIRDWWENMGKAAYPDATRLLVAADGGGSNGARNNLWKAELAAFAEEANLEIVIAHFPPGASKWNFIEHRLFNHVTMNWRGRKLVSYEVIVNLITNTTTRTGLRVRAARDTYAYAKGIKISKEEVAALDITRHEFHGDWNYTIKGKIANQETE
jgi:Rhodopirellula transposase DDE domain